MALKITDLSSEVISVINEEATELGISVRTSGTTSRKIIIECEEDRIETQEALEMHLENKINGVRISRLVKSDSIDWTHLEGLGSKLSLVYKNRAGGMAETTLNSSITELFPAIAFDQGISSNLNEEKFYSQIAYAKIGTGGVYKNATAQKAGKQTINDATNSSKFDEKVQAAQGIHKWLIHENERRPIKNVVWGYRNNTKPNGVNPNHKGDIFLVFKSKVKGDPDILGVSIKAGATGAKPPQFNSYVRAIFNSNAFGKLREYNALMRESYNAIYTGIPNIPAFNQYGKQTMTAVVGQFERTNKTLYEKLYDAQLEWLRSTMIDLINNNPVEAKRWLIEEVVKEQQGVPLIVIQSSGPNLNDVHEVNDEDVIKNCVSVSKANKGISARTGSGKQGWIIDLTCNSHTTSLNFSIRTNKSGTSHKLGQYVNLAVKFNGVA